MRHLWVIEENKLDKGWHIMSDVCPPEVYETKRRATEELRQWRVCMPDHYRYRLVKYTPEVKK